MADLTKQQLIIESNNTYLNNNSGEIGADDVRAFNETLINNTVNQADYTADSSSFDERIKTGGIDIPGLVSGSSQIDYPEISNIPSGIVSGSSQIDLSLATGVATSALTASRLEGNAEQVSHVDFLVGGDTAIEQRMSWNDTDGTLNLGLKGGNVTLQVGQELVTRTVNKSGVDLLEANYQVVQILGAQGNRLSVELASADGVDAQSTLGVVTETILINQEGFVTTNGIVRGIDTRGPGVEDWQDGDPLYLSDTTPGGLTNIKPTAPSQLVKVGFVITSAPNGSLYVKVEVGTALTELYDVTITSASNGDVLKYNSGLDLWENVPSADITGSFATLGSNTFTGGQTIQNNDGLVLQNNGGTGDVIITPGPDYITKFDSSTLTGIEIYGGNTLSSSFGSVGNITGGYGVQALLGPANNLRLGHGDSYSSFLSNGASGEVRLRGDKITMQGSSSVDSGVSLTINGDVSASVFTGSFVGDGSGLTLDSNIAYTNVSNTFTQAQTINGVTTINDETTDSNFKIFTVQKNNNDILTLFNSSSANNNEGELTLKGGLNVISEQGQNKIFVEDAGGNSAIIGTDSIGIKGASDSIPFTQLTAGGVWGRSLDSDNNNTALWISGTPTKINNYGYQLGAAYNNTVGVYTARGPQFGGTPARPMFYQYISSSAEYLAGDASIHFGSTITADEGFRTLPSILGGVTPMTIYNSNGLKFEIEAGGLESLGEPAIQMYGDTRIEGNTIVSGSLTLMPNVPIEATQVQANEAVITPFIESQTGTFTIGSNTVISGSVQLMPNVPLVATQLQANEAVVTPIIESSTGTITLSNNTILSGSLTLEPNKPIEATQIQANEAVITPEIESANGTLTLQSNTTINGSNAAPSQTFIAKDGNGTPRIAVNNATLSGLSGIDVISNGNTQIGGKLTVNNNSVIITSGSNNVEFSGQFSDGQAGVVFTAPNSKFNSTGNFNLQVQGIAATDANQIDLNSNTINSNGNHIIAGTNTAPSSTFEVKNGNGASKLVVQNEQLSGITGVDVILNGNGLVGGNLTFPAPGQVINIAQGVVEAGEVATPALLVDTIQANTGTNISILANGGTLQLSGSNVLIESAQPVSFNAGLTVNGATNFNTAVYKNRQEVSAANVNLTNETDNFVITLINGTTTNVAMQDLVGNNLNREVTLMVKQPSVGFGNLNFVTGSYGDPYNVMYAAGQSPYTASQAPDAVDTITLKSVGSTYDGTNYPIIVTGVYLDISGDLV